MWIREILLREFAECGRLLCRVLAASAFVAAGISVSAESLRYEGSFIGGRLAGSPVMVELVTEGSGVARTLADVIVVVDARPLLGASISLRHSEAGQQEFLDASFNASGHPNQLDVFYKTEVGGDFWEVDLFEFPVGVSFSVTVLAQGEESVATLLAADAGRDLNFARWMERFSGLSGPQGGEGAQPAQDGLANLLKFGFGFHPEVGINDVRRRILRIEAGADETVVAMNLPEWLERPSLRYVVESSEDLLGWTVVAAAEVIVEGFLPVDGPLAPTEIARDGDVVRFHFAGTAGQRFFRLRVIEVEEGE